MEGSRGGANDRNNTESARRQASINADHSGQPSLNVLEFRAMEGSRGAADTGDENDGKSLGRRPSFNVNQHGKPGLGVQESRAMEGSRVAADACDRDDKVSAVCRRRVSRYADQSQQSWLDAGEPGQVQEG